MVTEFERKIDLTKEFILSYVSDYDIFKLYMPWSFEINVPCLSPFVSEEHPSFIIGDKFENELTYKGFNSSHRGDCFNFVRELFDLDYNQALEKIAEDFGLIDGTERYKNMVAKGSSKYKSKRGNFVQAIPKKFTKADLEYWAKFYLEPKDLNFCPDTKMYSTGEFSVNRQRIPLMANELCFFYYLKNERGAWVKIYRPSQEDKSLKWKSGIPHREIMGLQNLKDCKVGFIQKSMKDGAVIAKFISPYVSVVQSEDISCFSIENIEYINQNCKEVYLIFDSDETGVRQSIEVTKELGWNHINPPKNLVEKGIKDFSDMIKFYNSPREVIEFFKQKGIEILK